MPLIYSIQPRTTRAITCHSRPFHPVRRRSRRKNERADYSPELTLAVRGKVTLDRRCHTARARVLGGSMATHTQACTVLLDWEPGHLYPTKVWQRMLGLGAASKNALAGYRNGKGGGKGGMTPSEKRVPTVCLAVYAHVVPDDAMTHAVLLGRDGWADFSLQKVRGYKPIGNRRHVQNA